MYATQRQLFLIVQNWHRHLHTNTEKAKSKQNTYGFSAFYAKKIAIKPDFGILNITAIANKK